MNNIIKASTLFLLGISIAWACTDIRLVAQDGTVMIARSMEFAEEMHSQFITMPRQTTFTTTTPDGKPGATWKNKYGYLLIDGFNLGVALDGMNEKGLSFEALLFPGEAEYQMIPAGKDQQALPYTLVGDWVLGNFETIEAVKTALPTMIVYPQGIPELKNIIFPIHFAIQDATGKGIVVEYVKGKLNIYDNMGVMTNSPTYDWHLTNLRNYVHLSPSNPTPVVANGVTYAATGQGAGMLGLPGDVSPPSRFVKMAVMLKTVLEPKDATEALNTAQHMMNNVDIPLGFVRVPGQENTTTHELTQWVVFKDLTHKKLYYRTYNDLSLRAIDLAKIDFSEKAASLKMPLASEEQFMIDMTPQLTTP